MSAVVVPLRWLRHGVDVCALVTATEVRWIMRDVALALFADARDFAGEPGHKSELLRDHGTATSWSTSTASHWLNANKQEAGSEAVVLMQWLVDQEAHLERQGLAEVVRLASPRNIPVTATGHPARELYTVAQAAEILDRDPAIMTGQNRLFDTMLRSGWTIRTGDSHRPSAEAVRLGYLEVTNRNIPVLDSPYPQLLVTVDGIRALHKRLGGQAEIRFTTTAPTALMETK